MLAEKSFVWTLRDCRLCSTCLILRWVMSCSSSFALLIECVHPSHSIPQLWNRLVTSGKRYIVKLAVERKGKLLKSLWRTSVGLRTMQSLLKRCAKYWKMRSSWHIWMQTRPCFCSRTQFTGIGQGYCPRSLLEMLIYRKTNNGTSRLCLFLEYSAYQAAAGIYRRRKRQLSYEAANGLTTYCSALKVFICLRTMVTWCLFTTPRSPVYE